MHLRFARSPPEPSLDHHIVPSGSLLSVQSNLLSLHLLEANPGHLGSAVGLEPREDLADPVLSDLLHLAKDAGSEERLGVTQPVLLLLKAHGVEDGGALVVLGQVHAEVHHGLLDALPHVLHLLQHEHVMIEELL